MRTFDQQDWYKYLASHCARKTFAAKDTIQFQGQDAQNIGIIVSGRAYAVAYSAEGDRTWLGEYVPGQFIGLISLLTDTPLNFELLADSTLVIEIMPASRMKKCLIENAALANAAASDLAARLNHTLSGLIDTHTLSVKGRICAELLRLSAPIGVEPDKHIIRPGPVFVDLARRVNSTRETVSRTVNELKRTGVVTRVPGALIIQDPGALTTAFR